MEAREPLANAKVMHPPSMITIHDTFSSFDVILTSPYPTVVMVVTAK